MLRLCSQVSVPAALSAYRTALALGYASPSVMSRSLGKVSPGALSCHVLQYERDEALALLEDTEHLNANAADDEDREESLDRSLDGFGDLGDAFLVEIRRKRSAYHWSDAFLEDRWNDLELAGLYVVLHEDFWASWGHGIVTPYSFLEEIEAFCPFYDEPGYFNNDPDDEVEGTATAFDLALRETPKILHPLFAPYTIQSKEEILARKRALSAHCPAVFRRPIHRLKILAQAFRELVWFIHLGPHVGDIVLHCADEETAMQASIELRLLDDWGAMLMQSGASPDFLGLAVVRGDYLALAMRLLQQIDAAANQLRSLLFEEVDHVAAA